MQLEVVNAVLKHLKDNDLKAHVSFPDVEFQDYAIIVTPVMFRDLPIQGPLDVQRGLDTALVSRVVSGAEVTVQIDVYAKTSIRRDQLVDQVRNVLKSFPKPTLDSPVLFLRISDARSLDEPNYYRTAMDVEFQVYDLVSDEVKLVKEVLKEIREV